MTNKSSAATENKSGSKRLFLIVGGLAVLFYWTTLSPWLSLRNLGTVARISGWSWQPEINRPLSWLVFAPFRWLPPDILPLVLNVLTAGLAALILVQLARSVAILRYDIVSADPMRQKPATISLFTGPWAWLPPGFAALALGLQLIFWEHATSASGEMLSVCCFAFAFRCVLEFRLDPQEKWLYRGALIYCAGLTDNWVMLAYLPVFGAAIVWAKGFGNCLEWRFFWRLVVCALLGLSLYLVVPIAWYFSIQTRFEFWPPLHAYLAGQKNSLLILQGHAFRLLALTGVLPFLLLAVRWRSHSVQLADDTHVGVFITKASGHIIHLLFLVAAVWTTLNPLFTPLQTEINAALLVYYYSWALVAGYGLGYLLLFGRPRAQRPAAQWPTIAALCLSLTLPVILIWNNFTDVRLTNSNALKEFAGQLYDDLPAGPCAALSDESLPLLLLRAELAIRHEGKNPLLIDTRAMLTPAYQERMKHDYGARWPESPATNRPGSPRDMLTMVSQLATNEPLVYLHPSSGLFFETFAGQPHGWVQYLHRRSQPTDSHSKAKDDARLQLWAQRWTKTLAPRSRQLVANRSHTARWADSDWKLLQLSSRANELASSLGGAYSKNLNHWGVWLRRGGYNAEAQEWFQRALTFDPNNLAARINLETVARARTNNTDRLTLTWMNETYPQLAGKYQTWAEVIGRNGPVDDATFLLLSGRTYFAGNNPQQARDCYVRSMALAPDWPAPKLGAAQTMNILGDFSSALELTTSLLQQEDSLRLTALVQLLNTRTATLWRLGQTNAALTFINEFTTRHQTDDELVASATDLCNIIGAAESELKWSEVLVQRNPKRPEWLIKQGRAQWRVRNFEAAHRTLTVALELSPASTEARFLRAMVAMQAGQLEAAEQDFQALLKDPGHKQRALFGLGYVAWQQRDTNAIIKYYQSFLSNSVPGSPQSAVAIQRLKSLQDE